MSDPDVVSELGGAEFSVVGPAGKDGEPASCFAALCQTLLACLIRLVGEGLEAGTLRLEALVLCLLASLPDGLLMLLQVEQCSFLQR